MELLVLASIIVNFVAFVLAVRLAYETRDWRLLFLAAMAVLVAVDLLGDMDFTGTLSATVFSPVRYTELTDVAVSAMVLLSVFFVGQLIKSERKQAEEAKASEKTAAEARTLLLDAMESTPDGIAIYDSDDRLKLYNRAFKSRILSGLADLVEPGVPYEKLLRAAVARNLVTVPQGDVEAYVRARLEHHRRGDSDIEVELKNGRWMLTSDRRLPGGGFAGRRSDITDRKRAELALRKSEQRLRTMIDNVPGIVFRRILQADGGVTFPFFSEQYTKALGISPDAAMKDPHVVLDKLHPEDIDEWMAAWRKSAKSLAPFDREVRVLRLPNDTRWFRIRAIPQRLPNGETLWDAIGIDVTDEKRATEVRDRTFAALENLSEGIALFGPDDRLIFANRRLIELNEETGPVVTPGRSFEEMLRVSIKHGRVPEAKGREEEWIEERLETHRNPPYTAERKVGSMWQSIREEALADGGLIYLVNDITEQKRASEVRDRTFAALENLSEGVALYGPDDRLVFANRRLVELNEGAGHAVKPGQSFEEIVRASLAGGRFPEAVGCEEEWIEKRLEAHRNPPYASERKVGSMWQDIREEALPDGSVIYLITDITERKRAQETIRKSEDRATAAHEQLMDAIESISEGFIFYDADERLILCNSTYRGMFPQIANMLVPGARLEDVARAAYERGSVVQAIGNVEGWMSKRLRHARTAHGTLEYQLNDGRWVISREKRTRGGGVVGIRTDITDLKLAERKIGKNEQQLTLVTENVPALISYIGRDERVRFANSAYMKSLGVPRQQPHGLSLREYWGEKTYATFSDKVKRVLAGETVSFENKLTANGGRTIYIAATYVPHFVNGEVDAFFSLATDITHLVTTRQALRARGQRIRNILENIADGVITIDEKGKIQSFNQAAERMFGYAATEIVGRSVTKLMPAPDRNQHQGYIRNYLETGKGKIIGVGRREVTALRKDGTTFPVSLAVSEMWTGGKRSFIGSLLDVTRQKAANQALRARDERLRQLQSELLRVNRAAVIGQLSSSLTHELKQPLTAATFYMQAIGQLLKKGGATTDKEITDIIDKIGDQVGRAATVVGRLGPLFERGEVERNELDINELVEDAVAVAALELDRNNIEIKTKLGRELPRVPVDKIQVQQVLLNLVRNGAEATRDSTKRQLTVRTRETKNSEVEVSVSDSGSGIPGKLRKTIFEPFVTTRVGGTGMGLSVSRTIVEAHGGHIWASPRRGGGTIMHFTLESVARGSDDQREP